MLKNYPFKAVYRSEENNILEDFYIPALSASVQYKRAVGFFSASMLSYASQGLSAFIKNGGSMQLIVGYELAADEAEAIEEGYDIRELSDRMGKEFVQIVEAVDDNLFSNRLQSLSWMIAGGVLDVKVALRKRGMYHEKIGVFIDEVGDSVVFEGSANESVNALLPDFNFESVSVYPSWRDELNDYYQPYFDGFERLWANKSPRTKVIDFPEAAREKLIRTANSMRAPPDLEIERRLAAFFDESEVEEDQKLQEPCLPETIGSNAYELREHQEATIKAWKNDGYLGVFALATGAGKTITAIHAAYLVYDALRQHSGKLILIVSVPFINLADQWRDNLRLYNIHSIPCYGSRTSWEDQFRQSLDAFNVGVRDFLCVVVVNATLRGDTFQALVQGIPGRNLMIIGDECHHYGSASLAKALPDQAKFRIGLSATPEHYIDEDATSRITDYFGRIVFEYDLRQALEDGVLSPYKYYVQTVELTSDEAEVYLDLTADIGALMSQRAGSGRLPKNLDERLGRLLMDRARLVGAAENKLPALDAVLAGRPPQPLSLFYCGDGNVDDPDMPDGMSRQVDAVIKRLYEAGWQTSRFTAREKRKDRREILDNFKVGVIDAMVAIRCLDEGIDVPAIRTAYILASSRNPRQFIQRRGRILRRSEGKEFAEIYDFMVVLPESEQANGADRNLAKAEIVRVAEFANLSLNPTDSYSALEPILEKYDLEHLIY
jgi:superfamily II DNA or RNA helicase